MDYSAMIDKKVSKINEDKQLAEKKEYSDLVAAKKRFVQTAPEVKKLFNILLELHSKLPAYIYKENLSILKKSPSGGSWNYTIRANGISHHFGLMIPPQQNQEITIGWFNGGFCGKWDVRCDGTIIWEQHENTGETRTPSAKVINEYCDRFYEFKELFEVWFMKNFGDNA